VVNAATNRVRLEYRWFGDPPKSRTTKPLPDHNGMAGPHRVMLWGDFEPKIQTMSIAPLVKRLFG
jgi:hypothetical protein